MNKPTCILCGSGVQQIFMDIAHYRIKCPTCGRYVITQHLLLAGLGLEEREKKHLLSAKTREASDAGTPITLTTENSSLLLDSMPRITTPLDLMNRVLLLVGRRQQRANESINFNTETDYPLVFAHDGPEFDFIIQTLVDQSLLSRVVGGGVLLTPQGWERSLELQRIQQGSNQAFVAMWFDESLNSAWGDGFKPALKSTGFDPYRVDKDSFNDKIDDHIIAEIRRSGLLVADFTGHRGGVYFEAGFAMGLGIPVIYTCRDTDIEKAHFDTRQYNHITWTTPADLKLSLAFRIAATIPGRIVKA